MNYSRFYLKLNASLVPWTLSPLTYSGIGLQQSSRHFFLFAGSFPSEFKHAVVFHISKKKKQKTLDLTFYANCDSVSLLPYAVFRFFPPFFLKFQPSFVLRNLCSEHYLSPPSLSGLGTYLLTSQVLFFQLKNSLL